MPNGYTEPERITALEVMVREIKDNHLKHLEAKVDRIQWLLITTLVAVLSVIVLKVFRLQ